MNETYSNLYTYLMDVMVIMKHTGTWDENSKSDCVIETYKMMDAALYTAQVDYKSAMEALVMSYDDNKEAMKASALKLCKDKKVKDIIIQILNTHPDCTYLKVPNCM